MAKKIINQIIYYNKGVAISINILRQPPDMITDQALHEAMRIILQMKQQPPEGAKVCIIQNGITLRTFNYTIKPP